MAVVVYAELVRVLKASAFLSGVSVAFGEEMIAAQDQPLPYIVLVPRGGAVDGSGYVDGLDSQVENCWSNHETLDVYMWAVSTDPQAQLPENHADAIWDLSQKVLSAFQDQRNQANADGSNAPGLYWKPTSARWETMANAAIRFGRARVLTIEAEVSIPMAAPVEATITTVTQSDTISH